MLAWWFSDVGSALVGDRVCAFHSRFQVRALPDLSTWPRFFSALFAALVLCFGLQKTLANLDGTWPRAVDAVSGVSEGRR